VADEEIGVVRHLYEAVNRGDWDRAAALLAGEVRWIPDNRIGLGPIDGKGDVIAVFRERTELFDNFRAELQQVDRRGDRVLVFVRASGRRQESGAGFEIRIGHVWTVRDGVVVRGEGYGGREEARAAGIPR
jgi:ketosteroid isomerase-like protein